MDGKERHNAIVAAQELERYARAFHRALAIGEEDEAAAHLHNISERSIDVLSFRHVLSRKPVK